MKSSNLSTQRSPAQVAASQQNGAKSRGPVTTTGKLRASYNAVRHGLFSRVLNPRDTIWVRRDEYDELVDDLEKCFQPVTNYERTVIELLAVDHTRLRQVIMLEEAHFGAPLLEVIQTCMSNLSLPVECGSPEQHEYVIDCLKMLEQVVNEGAPMMLTEDNLDAVALCLANCLQLPLRRLIEYIPVDGTRVPRRITGISETQKLAAVRAMLTSNESVRPEDKRYWIASIQQAIKHQNLAIRAAHEREAAVPTLRREHAAKWLYGVADGNYPGASLDTLTRYETALRRSIERNLKTLIAIKEARSSWARSQDAAV